MHTHVHDGMDTRYEFVIRGVSSFVCNLVQFIRVVSIRTDSII